MVTFQSLIIKFLNEKIQDIYHTCGDPQSIWKCGVSSRHHLILSRGVLMVIFRTADIEGFGQVDILLA